MSWLVLILIYFNDIIATPKETLRKVQKTNILSWVYDYINVISDICATYLHKTNHATANVGWLHIICKSYFRAARRRASDTLMIAWELAKRSFNQVKHHDRGCINSSTTCLIFTKVRHSKKTYWGDSGKILVTTKNIATGETSQAITSLTISTFIKRYSGIQKEYCWKIRFSQAKSLFPTMTGQEGSSVKYVADYMHTV